MRDDCLEETSVVKEALRRLDPKIYDQRQFRISRALDLSNKKAVLPKGEWTQFENVRKIRGYSDDNFRNNFKKKKKKIIIINNVLCRSCNFLLVIYFV